MVVLFPEGLTSWYPPRNPLPEAFIEYPLRFNISETSKAITPPTLPFQAVVTILLVNVRFLNRGTLTIWNFLTTLVEVAR